MPMEGISDARRMPRLGKIRLGIKVSNGKSEYPQPVDYFVCKADKTTSAEAAAAFHAVYGDKPRTIDVIFPSEVTENFFPQYYRRYASSRGLLCKGDGCKAMQVAGEPTGGQRVQLEEILCAPTTCQYFTADKPSCRPIGSLRFMLPKVPGLGVWQIDTSSYNSIVNVNSGLDFLRQLTGTFVPGGRVSMIPLKLKLIPQEITVPKTGMKKTVFVLTLAHDEIKLEDILKAAGQTLNKILLPDFDFDEAPDDLIAETILTSAPVHTEEPPPENPENETEPETDPRDAEIERLFTEMEIAPGKRRAMLGVPNLDKDALILKLQGLGQGLVQPLNVTKPQENKPAEQAPTTSRVPERSEAPVKVTPVATPKNGPQNLKSAEKKTRAVSQSLF